MERMYYITFYMPDGEAWEEGWSAASTYPIPAPLPGELITIQDKTYRVQDVSHSYYRTEPPAARYEFIVNVFVHEQPEGEKL